MKLVCINEQSRRRGSIGPNGTPTGITKFINDLNQQGKLSSADRAVLANNPNKSQYRRNEKGKNHGDMDRLRSRQRTHVDVVDQNDFDEDVHNRIGEFVERGILTKQQGAVIDQMAHGLTVKDIAAKLGLSTTRVSCLNLKGPGYNGRTRNCQKAIKYQRTQHPPKHQPNRLQWTKF